MNTTDLYYEILRIVEDITGVSAKEMLTSNCEEHVDARHILVYVLTNRGYSDTKISELTKLTRPCICMIRNNLGLAEIITFRTKKNVVINCSKCLTFWTTTGYSLFFLEWEVILSLLIGFSLSYVALWIELLLNVFNYYYYYYYYEKCYGKIYSEAGEDNTEQTNKMPKL